MKHFLIMLGLVSTAAVASAGEFLGDVRLPGRNEIDSEDKQIQRLEVQSCKNGFKVSEIQVTAEHAAKITKVTVVYGNNSQKNVPVRKRYKNNSSTRWKGIAGPNGKARCLKAVEIEGVSLSQDKLGGALVGINAVTEDHQVFNSGSVTFYRKELGCIDFGFGNSSFEVKYNSRRKKQKQLCLQQKNKFVRYALIQGKCTKLNKKQLMHDICPKVMSNQEHYYNHNGNPPLNILDLIFQ
jgi:hypothetical protein